MEVEANTKIDKGDLWTMFFDGVYWKHGVGVGTLFISPSRVT